MNIAYHGAGYIGLTGGVTLAKAGHDVLIYDPDQAVVDAVNAGKPKAGEFLRYLGDDFPPNLKATARVEDVLSRDIHLIAVPSEKGGEPYFEIVNAVIKQIHAAAPAPFTIILESTVSPGTIDKLLPELQGRGEVGKDWFLAVCPRRDWFADAQKNVASLPRIIGGVTPSCTSRAVEILSTICQDIRPTTYKVAEFVKALENTLLHTPCILADQLAVAFPDVDVAAAVELAISHWRFASLQPFYLNAGTSGRCIPIGPRYLNLAAGEELTLSRDAVAFDSRMREIVADAVLTHKPLPSKVCVLGASYRPEFRDAGLSTGLDIAKHLTTMGASTYLCDPMWSEMELRQMSCACPIDVDAVRDFDALVLATPHKAFDVLLEQRYDGTLIFDCQGSWLRHKATLEGRGAKYVRIGQPGWRGPGSVSDSTQDEHI